MKSTYIIGEIGQNHNGSVDIAKLIVDLVSRPVREEVFNLELRPMDAVPGRKVLRRRYYPRSMYPRLFRRLSSLFRPYLWRASRLLGADGRGAFRCL